MMLLNSFGGHHNLLLCPRLVASCMAKVVPPAIIATQCAPAMDETCADSDGSVRKEDSDSSGDLGFSSATSSSSSSCDAFSPFVAMLVVGKRRTK